MMLTAMHTVILILAGLVILGGFAGLLLVSRKPDPKNANNPDMTRDSWWWGSHDA